jgi:CheY-like chemotaxis protein
VQRIQADAVHLLARHLWERWQAGGVPEAEPLLRQADAEPAQAADWRAQADREVASLAAFEPEACADVGEIVQSVLDLERTILDGHGVGIVVRGIEAGLIAGAHPAVLRQALIVAISRLSQAMSGGVIRVRAAMDEGDIRIVLSAPSSTCRELSDTDLIADMILPQGASVSVHRGRQSIRMELRLPASESRVVIVVEDNHDMVVFYRHCVAGHPYRIVHFEPDTDVVGRIGVAAPDAVVLDVMMPHVDGWQVLTHLRALPSTREIPVIVCSVIKEGELAHSLGAACFLSKPVHPRQFVRALNRVMQPA